MQTRFFRGGPDTAGRATLVVGASEEGSRRRVVGDVDPTTPEVLGDPGVGTWLLSPITDEAVPVIYVEVWVVRRPSPVNPLPT